MNKISRLVLLALLAATGGSLRMGGVNLIGEGFEGPYPYGSSEMATAIRAARDANVSWLCFSFVAAYTSSLNSTGPFYPVPGATPSGAPFNNASTPTVAAVQASIEYAQSIGLKVILRPIIDPDWRLPWNNQASIYRGDIGLTFNASQWEAWFVSYQEMLKPWLSMAQDLAIDGFCMGAELTASESQPGAWRAVSQQVRAAYTVPGGLVYYSSVLEGNSEFPWDVSDFVAVYPRLNLKNPDPTAATVSELVAAWQPTISALSALSRSNGGKQVLLAESGICSANKSGLYLTPGYYACYPYPPNEDVQAKYYESLFQAAWVQPWAAGVFFWKWALQGGVEDTTFFPLNKSAARVMAAYFGAAAVASSNSVASTTYYVSTSGNDAWSGLLPSPSGNDGPFKTPSRAAVAVSAVPRPLASDVVVQLRAGVYPQASPLVLAGPLAGGDVSHTVRWMKYPGDAGDAVLSGGGLLQGWTLVGPGIYRAALPAGSPPRSRELSVNGRRVWPARVPQVTGPSRPESYSDASTLHFTSSLSGCGFNPPTCWGNSCPGSDAWGFVYDPKDPRSPSPSWVDITGIDVVVFGAWTAAWAPVAAIYGANSSLITSQPLSAAVPGQWGGKGCPSGARYALYNVFEALTSGSGAFYVDDAEGMLYYAPLPGEDITTLQAIVPILSSVINLGTSTSPLAFVELSGLNVTDATDGGQRYQQGYAPVGVITASNATSVVLSNCSVSGGGGSGVLLLGGLVQVTLSGCEMRDLGGDGVGAVWGTSFDAINTTVTDCVVEGSGFIFMDQPTGVRAMGAADGVVTITHNHIRDSSYAGVMAGWHPGVRQTAPTMPWRYVISDNLVEDCGQSILSDFAGIYVSSAGTGCEADSSCFIPTLVTRNLVRNIRGYNYGGNGVYTDENVAGVTFVGNALTNISGDAVYLHCGLNQTVINNLLYDGHATDGPDFSTGLLGACNTGGVPVQFTNISAQISTNVWLVNGPGSTLFQADLYPTANMSFSSNVYWAVPPIDPSTLRWPPSNSKTFSQWTSGGEDVDSLVADPLVADAAGGNFTLLPGSPALARGFQQLNLSTVGPRI